MKILAVDPGITTGYAFTEWDMSNKLPMEVPFYTKLPEDKIKRYQGKYHRDFENLMLKYNPDVIVMENFRIYPSKAKSLIGDEMETSQVIGIVKYIAHKKQVPVILQMASQAKKAFPREKLERLGINPSQNDEVRHSGDAVKHLLYFIQFNSRKDKVKKQMKDTRIFKTK